MRIAMAVLLLLLSAMADVRADPVADAARALQRDERAHGEQSVAAADALERLLDTEFAEYWHETHGTDVLAQAERLLRLRARPDGEESIAYARAQRRYGFALANVFRHADAMQAFERASAITAAQAGPATPEHAESLLALGVGRRNLRKDFPGAAEALQRGLAIAGLPPLRAAQGQLWLASCEAYLGQRDAAANSLQRAETLLRDAVGARHPLHVDLANQRALLHMLNGEPAKAVESAQRASELAANAQPYSTSLHFIALYSQAQTEQRLQHLDAAMRLFERAGALPDVARINGGYSLAMLDYSVCNNLYHRDPALAEPRCLRAANGFEALAAVPPLEAASAWTTIGGAQLMQGRGDEAYRSYQRSMTHAAQAGPATQALASVAELGLGTIELHRGEFDTAEAKARHQLELLREGGDFGQRTARTPRALLAAVLWATRRYAEGFREAALAERSAARARRVLALELDERRALASLSAISGGLELMLAIAHESGDAAQAAEAWDAALDAFGVESTWAARRLASARSQRDPALAPIWQTWRDAHAALAQQRLQAARGHSDDDALRQAEQRFETAELALAQRTATPGARLLDTREGFDAVRRALPADASLVRFVELPSTRARDYGRGSAASQPQLLALVTRREGAVRVVDLGARDAVRDDLQRWYALSARPEADAAARTLAAQALYRRLWKPLTLRDVRVFLVADPALTRLNVVALQDEGGAFLIERGLQVHLIEHERTLLRAPRAAQAGAQLLLAGAPALAPATATTRGDCPALAPSRLGPLQGAAREIAAIAALAGTLAHPAQVLRGAQAREGAVRAAMPGKRILHFATHGLIYDAGCAAADGTRAVALSGTTAASSATANRAPADVAALLWSDPGADALDDDGLLTSDEIAALDLDEVEWAVLSACETALGPAIGREGVGGLRRAFMLAGVRSVVMSLWRVDDQATADFMDALYRLRLRDGLGTDAAMHAAMRTQLAARRARGDGDSPYFWAGFVASGDWR
jgi:CHAT domain-containing protein